MRRQQKMNITTELQKMNLKSPNEKDIDFKICTSSKQFTEKQQNNVIAYDPVDPNLHVNSKKERIMKITDF